MLGCDRLLAVCLYFLKPKEDVFKTPCVLLYILFLILLNLDFNKNKVIKKNVRDSIL